MIIPEEKMQMVRCMRSIVLAAVLSLVISVVAEGAWENRDIGGVGSAGSVQVSGDVYTIRASGDDIWGSGDEFHYMYTAMSGDGDLTARVISVQNTDGWAKAGVMVRETLSASSAFAMMVVTPGNGADMQWRPGTGSDCSNVGGYSTTPPYYVKIVRSGNTIRAYHSANGSTWTQHGSASIPMASDVYIGLCLTSHNDGAVCTAQFDSVEGTAVSGTWRAANVSPPSGAKLVNPDGAMLAWGPGAEPPGVIDRFSVYLANEAGVLGQPSAHLCTISAGADLKCFSGALAGGTDYYWRVDSIIDGVETAVGSVWSFTTAVAPIDICPQGDVDGDCAVTAKDLLLLSAQWLDNPACPGGSEDCADVAASGRVDTIDFLTIANDWHKTVGPVVINEIHSDPDVKTELAEFVELHNVTDGPLNVSGWYFSRGFEFVFGPGSTIPAGGFAVIAQNAAAFQSKFGFAPAGEFQPSPLTGLPGRLSNEGETITFRNADGKKIDQVDYQLGFPWPTVGDSVPAAKPPTGNGHSLQLINPGLDNDLGGSWRSKSPTPGGANLSLSANCPPLMRQVDHTPEEPVGGEAVKITAKVTDPDGVRSVTLSYQIVEPGGYIALHDAQYQTKWTHVEMFDDGTHGDVKAFNDKYTAILPAGVQVHRRLIRYRITAVDETGLSITGPYSDDPQPNFAYFVYDGVPAWHGAIQPGFTPVVEYSPEVSYQQEIGGGRLHVVRPGRRELVQVVGDSGLRREGLRPYPLPSARWRVALCDGQEHVEVRFQSGSLLPGSGRLRQETRHQMGQDQFLCVHSAGQLRAARGTGYVRSPDFQDVQHGGGSCSQDELSALQNHR